MWYTRAMGDIFSMYADVQPAKAAIIEHPPDGEARVLTYAEAEAAANRLGHALAGLGVGAGESLAWCGPNSTEVVLLIHAARKIGATAVPVNYRLTDTEAAYVIDHCDASVLYVDAQYAPMVARIREAIPKVRAVIVYRGDVPTGTGTAGFVATDELTAGHSEEPPPDATPGATMIYTSGTTGKPKGALRGGALDANYIGTVIAEIGFTPDDVYLTTGPLYHSGPSGFMGIAVALGQTVVLQRKFDPLDWLRLVETYRVSSTFSAPTPIRMICNLPEPGTAAFDVSSMKRMVANAAPWSFTLKQQYLSRFPEDSLFEVYGSTELGVNCILRPEDQLRKPGACGQPLKGLELRLYDDDGRVVTATGPDHPGELFMRGSSVFADYYKQHDRFLEDHRDGFQTVGDIAYLDDEGYVYICDRKRDMIISGGMNIYPAEVEAAIDSHPDVYEAAVFGIPSEEWGEEVHAVVVARPGAGLDEAAVIAHAREQLASYKVPRSVSWIDELPKTGSGKVLKRELRAPFWAGRSSRV
jgi:acyl-CoA synthetase (AMP-forming)/AMP-acid ligase II